MSSETVNRTLDIVPKLIDLFNKKHKTIDESNIKIWGSSKMLLRNVAVACEEIKNKSSNNTIAIFTNKVPEKKYFLVKMGVNVYDEDDLKKFAIEFDDLDLYDML